MDNNISVISYNSIDDINKEEWDSIVGDNHIINKYGYLKAIEHSKINELRYKYYLFYENNKILAHVSLCIFNFTLDVMAGNNFKKICDQIRKIFPKFLAVKFIECGHPSCLGNTICVTDKNYLPDVVKLLDAEMIKLAKSEKTTLIGIRDFYTSEIDDYNILLKNKYKVILNLSNTFLKIEQKSFNDYLDDLISKRRHEISHRLETFYKNGCTIEKIYDFSGLSNDIFNLWYNTFLNAKEYQREILNKNYFKFISEYLGEKSFVFLCKKNGKPIGFTMFLDSGDTLVSTYCGLDYEFNKSDYAYFVLFYKSIEEAINTGKKWLELGLTNYNPKIEIGAMPEPLYIYIKSTNNFINQMITVLLKIINVSPNFNKRSIFNNRYFERHKINEQINIKINNNIFKLIDISTKGISIEGNSSLKTNHTYNLEIQIPEDFYIFMKAKIKSMTKLENNNLRFGLFITDIKNEYIIHWDNLINKFSKIN